MSSQSPPAAHPDDFVESAGRSALTFKLPSKRSTALLANRGLADLYKIFGVRATMAPCKDAADVVEVTLTGSNHYAVLAHHWVIARVAPECVMNVQLSSAQFQAIFGAKQHKLAELQHHSCCYAAENPRGSGNLLLQGSHQDSAQAVQWLSRIASAKRLSIDLETQSLHCSDLSPFRLRTPFQSHAMQLRPCPGTIVSPLPSASHHNMFAAPSSPASFTQSVDRRPCHGTPTSNSKSPTQQSRFSLRPDLPLSKTQSACSPPLPLLKPSLDKKCPAPIIIDGESVALSHGKGYFFSTRGLQLVYDWFARRGHDCVIVTLPERLDEHPNNQRPPLIDSEVLHSMNTSGALVADADPVSRILSLAQRPSDSLSPFHVLQFHISGSSFTILPKLPTHASGAIDSILMPSQNDTRSSVFAVSPIVVSSKQKPVTPLLTPKSVLSGTTTGRQETKRVALLKNHIPMQSAFCKANAPRLQSALHVLPISFGRDALDLVCDPSVWL